MLESIGHKKFMEWAAYLQIEQEEEEKRLKQQGNKRTISTL